MFTDALLFCLCFSSSTDDSSSTRPPSERLASPFTRSDPDGLLFRWGRLVLPSVAVVVFALSLSVLWSRSADPAPLTPFAYRSSLLLSSSFALKPSPCVEEGLDRTPFLRLSDINSFPSSTTLLCKAAFGFDRRRPRESQVGERGTRPPVLHCLGKSSAPATFARECPTAILPQKDSARRSGRSLVHSTHIARPR